MQVGHDMEYDWSPPLYDLERTRLLSSFSLTEELSDTFVRAAKWCPDGSCALAQCENHNFTFLHLPSFESLAAQTDRSSFSIPAQGAMAQPAPILDYAWYPRATKQDPASYCFIASVRECPVKLLDASDGRLRASYRIVDHRERQVAPHSLAFNTLSDKIYCGFDSAIEQFSLHQPGEGLRLHTTPSKKCKEGLKGIISSLAFSPLHPIYAAGSFTPSVANLALFDETAGETPIMFVGNDTCPRAAVMQLHFNPVKPHILYASFRGRSGIHCWDLRSDVETSLCVFDRALDAISPQEGTGGSKTPSTEPTNQRLRFDVDLSGRWLAVGDTDGFVSVFDLTEPGTEASQLNEEAIARRPTWKFRAHDDAIGSVGFHSLRPLLMSVSGSRHFELNQDADPSDSDSDSSEERVDRGNQRPAMQSLKPFSKDSSIKVWIGESAMAK